MEGRKQLYIILFKNEYKKCFHLIMFKIHGYVKVLN